jgi:hypothetical protein
LNSNAIVDAVPIVWVIFGLVSAVAALDFFDFSAWVFWSRRSIFTGRRGEGPTTG